MKSKVSLFKIARNVIRTATGTSIQMRALPAT
jgi:hypothetical protein